MVLAMTSVPSVQGNRDSRRLDSGGGSKRLESVLASHLQRLYRDQGVLVVEDQGQKHPRVCYFCTVCSKWAFTDASLADHLQGKRHAKALASAPLPPAMALPLSPWQLVAQPCRGGNTSVKLASSSPPALAPAPAPSPSAPSPVPAAAASPDRVPAAKWRRLDATGPSRKVPGSRAGTSPPTSSASVLGKLANALSTPGKGRHTSRAAIPLPLPPWKLVKDSKMLLLDAAPRNHTSRGNSACTKQARKSKGTGTRALLPKGDQHPSLVEGVPGPSKEAVDAEPASFKAEVDSKSLKELAGVAELAVMVLDYSDNLGRGQCACRCSPKPCSCPCSCALPHQVQGERDESLLELMRRQKVEKGGGEGAVAGKGAEAEIQQEDESGDQSHKQQQGQQQQGSRKKRRGYHTRSCKGCSTVAGERHCFICGLAFRTGQRVGAPWSLEKGQPACSSRNDHGKFHIFHVDCLRDWLLFSRASVSLHKADRGSGTTGSSSSRSAVSGSKSIETWTKTVVSAGLQAEALRAGAQVEAEAGARGRLGISPGGLGLASSFGISGDEAEAESASGKGESVGGCSEGWAGVVGQDELEGWSGAAMAELFCPECQGTGRRAPGGSLEHPRYRLSQVYDWILAVLLARVGSPTQQEGHKAEEQKQEPATVPSLPGRPTSPSSASTVAGAATTATPTGAAETPDSTPLLPASDAPATQVANASTTTLDKSTLRSKVGLRFSDPKMQQAVAQASALLKVLSPAEGCKDIRAF